MVFFENIKKLFTEELLTKSNDSYSKQETHDKFVEAEGNSEINGTVTVNSIKTKDGLEIY